MAGQNLGLEPVDEDKQADPDHIDKVPVPRHGLEGEMVFFGEMAAHGAEQNYR